MSRRPPKIPRPEPVDRVRSPTIDRLPAAPADAFWAGLRRTPLVEPGRAPGESIVTFCLREPRAQQVLLFANRLTDETDLDATLLERHPGTDLWHASFRMRSDWRASYCFLVQRQGRTAPWEADGHVDLRGALDHGIADPFNPERCRNRAGIEQSVVSLPDAPAQPWLRPREGVPAGTVTASTGPDGRAAWVYDPPGSDPRMPLPLLVMLDGEVWTSHQSLPITLDNLLADGLIGTVRAVLPDSGTREQRWAELGGPEGTAYLADRLVPWMRGRRAISGEVLVMGQSLGGLTALRAGLTRADVFTGAAAQSASLWLDDLGEAVSPGRHAHLHLAWGEQEWVLDAPHRDLAQRLAAAGVEVELAPVNGGHDYAWWRGAVADAMRSLLGRRDGPAG